MKYHAHKIESKFKYLTFGVFVFFLAASTLSIYILIFPDSESSYIKIIALVISSIFGLVTYFSFKTILSFKKYDICLDQDGIWHNYQNKSNGLIKWSEIKKFKEYQYLQKLQLLNSNNEKLIDVHYQLDNFSDLKDKLVENIASNFNSVVIIYILSWFASLTKQAFIQLQQVKK